MLQNGRLENRFVMLINVSALNPWIKNGTGTKRDAVEGSQHKTEKIAMVML
jgi:hypothetical protein